MDANQIFDTSVAIGKKEGIITVFTAVEYPTSSNREFEIVFPEMLDYLKAIEIGRLLQEKGTMIGAIDILIASMCVNREAVLVTKDKDFESVQKVMPSFLVKFV